MSKEKKSLLSTLIPPPVAKNPVAAAELDALAESIHTGVPVQQQPKPQSQPVDQPRVRSPRQAKPAAKTASAKPRAKRSDLSKPAQDPNAPYKFSVEFPNWIMDKIRDDARKNGLTVKGMMLMIFRERYG